jgi:pyruvate,water dikinase
VAETFPDPLSELEVDLFTAPLRNGIIRALRVTGAATDRQLADSPVLTTLDGRVAVDLELLGVVRGHRKLRNWVNPAVLLRRLGAAWRVGRARNALPALAAEVVHVVDDHLTAIGDLGDLETSQLIDLLDACARELETTHAYEILAGMLLPSPAAGVPSAAVALDALRRGRSDGLDDHQIVERSPEVLALVPPAIGPLPALPAAGGGRPAQGGVDDLDVREALRLRCRWLQELEISLAIELGRRLAELGRIPKPSLVRHLTLSELRAVAADATVPADLEARAGRTPSPALPDAFRLSSGGQVLPTRHRRHATSGGIPAGGGRVVGTVRHRVRPGSTEPGVVLVTRHLEPQLAPLLPSIDGLVSETGSALSHLAILAREYQVPTVVGVADALVRFPPGTQVLVDGATGEVSAAPDLDAERPVTGSAP